MFQQRYHENYCYSQSCPAEIFKVNEFQQYEQIPTNKSKFVHMTFITTSYPEDQQFSYNNELCMKTNLYIRKQPPRKFMEPTKNKTLSLFGMHIIEFWRAIRYFVAPFRYKTPCFYVWYFHHKDKTFIRPSHNGVYNPIFRIRGTIST